MAIQPLAASTHIYRVLVLFHTDIYFIVDSIFWLVFNGSCWWEGEAWLRSTEAVSIVGF